MLAVALMLIGCGSTKDELLGYGYFDEMEQKKLTYNEIKKMCSRESRDGIFDNKKSCIIAMVRPDKALSHE